MMNANEKRTLTTGGFSVPLAIFMVIALVASVTSIYLSIHYYEIRYPSGLKEAASSICNLSSFFNCDGAAFSKIADFQGIPLGALGSVLSVFFFFSALFPSENWEQTNKSLSLINLLGCIALFFYSIIVLKSLCPLCTLYYVCSLGFVIMYAKFNNGPWFSFKLVPTIVSALILAFIATCFYKYTHGLNDKQTVISKKIINEYMSLPKLEPLKFESPYYLSELVSDPSAKVKISIFSDFQCPHCKRVAKEMDLIIRRFKNQIAINYYFFPLDSACNPQINSAMHPFACRAAMIAACDPKKFATLHDEIFKYQDTLSEDFLSELAQKNGVKDCADKKESYPFVEKTIQQGVAYNIESTPTMVINGVKIEGAIPPIHLISLIEDLLTK
ncbi:MAG: thioredoxin domain-containing protein [Bacteriovoracaceae bacterium]|nr:thioredoxin domain-containing protein [Bacteriovoracaceae bacterium]